jgi:hypothetical protein
VKFAAPAELLLLTVRAELLNTFFAHRTPELSARFLSAIQEQYRFLLHAPEDARKVVRALSEYPLKILATKFRNGCTVFVFRI